LLTDAWQRWTRWQQGTPCADNALAATNTVGRWQAGCVDADALACSHASVLDQAVHVIGLVRPLVDLVTRRDRDLASQLRRALSHVALHVAEGFGAGAGNARGRYESARSALYEAQAVLRVATAWGYLSPEQAHSVLEPMRALGQRVFGLSRR
jgi:four helix bundle protein